MNTGFVTSTCCEQRGMLDDRMARNLNDEYGYRMIGEAPESVPMRHGSKLDGLPRQLHGWIGPLGSNVKRATPAYSMPYSWIL